MKVLKFGGTSVGTSESLQRVKDIVAKAAKQDQLAVVVSAFSGVTNQLIEISQQAIIQDDIYKESVKRLEERHINMISDLIPIENRSGVISHIKQIINELESVLDGVSILQEISTKIKDRIQGYGELMSSYIINEFFKIDNLDSIYKDSRELIITLDTQANIHYKLTNDLCVKFFGANRRRIVVLPGFIASTEKQVQTTLGRGGSDFTAAILASAIVAKELQIWTDVSGVYTANPTLVKQAQPIDRLSYLEAMELSHFGAKVLYPPTILPVLKKKVPVYVKNTFAQEDEGTLITETSEYNQHIPIKGISCINDIALLTIEGSGMIGVVGVSKKFFGILSQEQINIILITQASSEHSICIAIHQEDAQRAKKMVDLAFEPEIALGKINLCIVERELSILAIVGDGMRDFQGISGKMFSNLGRNNVNIHAIAQGSSERNISTVIDGFDTVKGLNSLHECFFEENIKQINLFITGVGNVGNKFLEQVQQQNEYLRDSFKLNFRVVALSNSKKMYFDKKGIELSNWQELLEQGTSADIEGFYDNVASLNLRNSIFVDITANEQVSRIYAKYLKNSMGVVTCNKIACSSDYDNYKKLKQYSKKYNAPLQFETNVGAALPIIDTLKNLMASGDEIKEIHAVLSGSLNFIFNNFKADTTFHDVVLQAKDEGYTEPDPKIDLSGIDVARKILILVRESGLRVNIDDIATGSFLPKACLETSSVAVFFQELKKAEPHFQELLSQANKNKSRLKYVATFKDGKAQVGLQEVPESHPFYNLEGKDNIVLFYTKRYSEQPLLIKGAGAGADVTASGIFADVIRAANI